MVCGNMVTLHKYGRLCSLFEFSLPLFGMLMTTMYLAVQVPFTAVIGFPPGNENSGQADDTAWKYCMLGSFINRPVLLSFHV